MFRQGDVLLVPVGTELEDGSIVPEIPADAVQAASSILARGEAHGHAHVISRPSAVRASGGSLWVDVTSGKVTLSHTHESALKLGGDLPVADHQPIEVPPGRYLVLIEQDYTPEGLRYVED